MIRSNAYNFINVLDKAADAAWKRNEILSNNIANVSTPNYKRKDIEFESYLAAEIKGTASVHSLRKAVGHVDVDGLRMRTYTDRSGLSYRLDGNNVDIDSENVELASNQIKYNGLIESITSEFNMLKSAMVK